MVPHQTLVEDPVVKLVKASLDVNEGAADGDTHANVKNKGAGPNKWPRDTRKN